MLSRRRLEKRRKRGFFIRPRGAAGLAALGRDALNSPAIEEQIASGPVKQDLALRKGRSASQVPVFGGRWLMDSRESKEATASQAVSVSSRLASWRNAVLTVLKVETVSGLLAGLYIVSVVTMLLRTVTAIWKGYRLRIGATPVSDTLSI